MESNILKCGRNTMQNNMYSFAFIGCGKMARFHAEALSALGHSIVAVSARSYSENVTFFLNNFGVGEYYTDNETLLAHSNDVDAFVVCTPWNVTERVIAQVVMAGKPVLVEKPIALSLHAIQEILKKVGDKSQNVLVGYNRRFYESVQFVAKKILESHLQYVSITLPEIVDKLKRKYATEIRDYILEYMSSHWFDVLQYLLGVLHVDYVKKICDKNRKHTGYYGVFNAGDAKTPVVYQSRYDAPERIEMKFVFDDETYLLSPVEELSIIDSLTVREISGQTTVREYVPNVVNKIVCSKTFKPGIYEQSKYFVEAYISKSREKDCGCTLEQAYQNSVFCESIKSLAE